MQPEKELRNRSLIRRNETIRQLLKERFESLELTQKNVIEDAQKHEFHIECANLNRYLKNNEKGLGRNTLTEPQILWLCKRYCISISITVEPKKYNYTTAKKNMNE